MGKEKMSHKNTKTKKGEEKRQPNAVTAEELTAPSTSQTTSGNNTPKKQPKITTSPKPQKTPSQKPQVTEQEKQPTTSIPTEQLTMLNQRLEGLETMVKQQSEVQLQQTELNHKFVQAIQEIQNPPQQTQQSPPTPTQTPPPIYEPQNGAITPETPQPQPQPQDNGAMGQLLQAAIPSILENIIGKSSTTSETPDRLAQLGEAQLLQSVQLTTAITKALMNSFIGKKLESPEFSKQLGTELKKVD